MLLNELFAYIIWTAKLEKLWEKSFLNHRGRKEFTQRARAFTPFPTFPHGGRRASTEVSPVTFFFLKLPNHPFPFGGNKKGGKQQGEELTMSDIILALRSLLLLCDLSGKKGNSLFHRNSCKTAPMELLLS